MLDAKLISAKAKGARVLFFLPNTNDGQKLKQLTEHNHKLIIQETYLQ